MRLRDHVDRARKGRRGKHPSVAGEDEPGHFGPAGVVPGSERSRPQRVTVDTGTVLGEVQVQPRRFDVTDKLMLGNSLVVTHGGDHVPVAEVNIPVSYR